MSDELTLEMAVCCECLEVYQTAMVGSPCLSSDCEGEYHRVAFTAEEPSHE